MLIKVFQDQEIPGFLPFSPPEIGDGKYLQNSVNSLVIPAFEAFRLESEVDEIISNSPVFVPGVEDLLQTAHNEAARIIARAEENATIIEQQASDRADQQAKAEFVTEARVEEIRARFVETIEKMSALSDEISRSVESDLVELALRIAKKIVRREVTIDREIALTLVTVSLEKLHHKSVAEVHLSPDDFAYVAANREKFNFRGSLEFVEDHSVSTGGCLIHTDTGDIDARIESQFDEIAFGLFS